MLRCLVGNAAKKFLLTHGDNFGIFVEEMLYDVEHLKSFLVRRFKSLAQKDIYGINEYAHY